MPKIKQPHEFIPHTGRAGLGHHKFLLEVQDGSWALIDAECCSLTVLEIIQIKTAPIGALNYFSSS